MFSDRLIASLYSRDGLDLNSKALVNVSNKTGLSFSFIDSQKGLNFFDLVKRKNVILIRYSQ